MSSAQDTLIGRMIDGRYLVESHLGEGGMGAVYLARDLKVLGRTVVVKVLLEEAFKNEYVVKKFRQEAEALSRMDHPNIVGILDYGEMDNHQPYLVLHYINGVSLRAILQPGGIELDRAANLIRQVSYALTASHEKGILHRDLKPENVMLQNLGGEERAVVIDFGIAQLQDSVIAAKTIITATAGTIAYMSPEQLSASPLSPASDVYALGIIAYELTTGEKPFNPKSPFQLLEMQRDGAATLPSVRRPEIPEAAQAAIVKALAFDPDQRFQSAREFGNELYAAITGIPVSHSKTASNKTPLPLPSVADIAAAPTVPLRPGITVPEHAPTEVYKQPPENPTTDVSAAPETADEIASAPGSRRIVVAAILLLLTVIIGGIGFVLWKRTQSTQGTVVANVGRPVQPSSPATTQQPPVGTQQGPVAAQPAAGRSLDYSLTVQKMRDGKVYKEPFNSTGREIFENGWRFRLNISSTEAGFLYILNEGLDDKGKAIYTMLFPINGDATLAANQTAHIPAQPRYYYFTGEAGTEKIWIIWSKAPVPLMEKLKSLVNDKDEGEISNEQQAEAVRAFLSSNTTADASLTADTVNKLTKLTFSGDTLVHRAELEHH